MTIPLRRLTTSPTFFILCSLLLGTPLTACSTLPAAPQYSLEQIRPTQTSIGFAAIRSIRENYASRAAKNGQSLKEYLAERAASEPLRGVRSPDGQIFLTDGHHRTRVTSDLIHESGAPAARIPVRLDADFTNDTWEAFAAHMVAHNDLYLDPPIRKRVQSEIDRGQLTAAGIFARADILPANIGALPDNPLRSVIGNILYPLGLKGEHFANYLEFHLGERLGERLGEHVKVKAGEESDPKKIAAVRHALFTDPALIRALRCNARDENPEEYRKTQSQISDALLSESPKQARPDPDFKKSSCKSEDFFGAALKLK
jgi:hypothetical protein